MSEPSPNRLSPPLSPPWLGVTIALHLAIFWGLAQFGAIAAPTPLAVLEVSLLPPPPAPTPRSPTVPPKPRPEETRVTPPLKSIPPAAPAESPTAAPTPVAAPPTPTAPPPPAAAAPTVAPLQTPPRFDADYLYNPKPDYPALSRRLNEQGRVLLRVHVTSDGTAGEVQLHASSGSSRLDQSALDTVRRWRFVPARLGREPVSGWVLVPIVFTLKE